MSDTIKCQQCCSELQVVNVVGPPGADGAAGTNGTNGINAFTFTTAGFTVPTANGTDTVNIPVGVSSWMVVGQNISITGLGIFTVSSIPTSSSVVVTYPAYVGNSHGGDVIATVGLGVSPSGTQPTAGTLLPLISGYATGGSQALSTVVLTQGLGLQLTLGAAAATYLLMGTFKFDYVGATFAANQLITVKLRRTNNTAGDVADSIATFQTAIITTQSNTAFEASLPPVSYTTAGVGDTIQMMVSIDAIPSAGSVHMVAASIVAVPLF